MRCVLYIPVLEKAEVESDGIFLKLEYEIRLPDMELHEKQCLYPVSFISMINRQGFWNNPMSGG